MVYNVKCVISNIRAYCSVNLWHVIVKSIDFNKQNEQALRG